MSEEGTRHDPVEAPSESSGWFVQDQLRIDVARPRRDTVVLSLHGDVDMASTAELREALDEHLQAGARVVLDTQHCTFFGSSGLAVLVEARCTALRTGAELRLVVTGQDRILHRALAIAGLSGIVPIDATVAEATDKGHRWPPER